MTLEQFLSFNIFQFFLIFCRIGGAMIVLPGYGEAYVPAQIRLVLALVISLVAMPMLKSHLPPMPAGLDGLAMLLGSELGVGMFFGSVARVLLLATQSAGMIIALQIGVANALVNDPITAQQGAVPGNFLLALALALIFVTGLDHMALKSLIGTYAVIVPGVLPPMGDVANFMSRTAADSFVLAVQLAAPFLVYGLVFAVGLGLLARLMPALQVFFVATPIQLLGGISIFAVSVTTASLWFLNSYEEHLSNFLGQAR
ncbi:MAG TPA: flagellar biosynthetic protein FliR [Dongiaceae bacterium]|nr:flagellar biosynthetic protein FliR [Dongiaceae bacterium]